MKNSEGSVWQMDLVVLGVVSRRRSESRVAVLTAWTASMPGALVDLKFIVKFGIVRSVSCTHADRVPCGQTQMRC
jgi:hypothetical protein